jgi:hypothetical protein
MLKRRDHLRLLCCVSVEFIDKSPGLFEKAEAFERRFTGR